MATKVPTIRQSSWVSFFPQAIIMLLMIYFYSQYDSKNAALYGIVTYLLIYTLLRNLIPRHHRNGIRLIKEKQFENAISEFENSYIFFTKNLWIDKFRFVILLSPSKMNYREMALCNIAFSYSQIGNGTKAIEYYKRALFEFPQNGIAESALKMLTSVSEGDKAIVQHGPGKPSGRQTSAVAQPQKNKQTFKMTTLT